MGGRVVGRVRVRRALYGTVREWEGELWERVCGKRRCRRGRCGREGVWEGRVWERDL